MKIYLVRHAESEGNKQKIIQHHSTSLSEHGISQAKLLAKRLKNINCDRLISSHYTRAMETAEIIADELKINIEVNENFHERKKPTSIIVLEKNTTKSTEVMSLLKNNFGNKEYKHSDEENYFDLLERADNAIKFLSDIKNAENVVVVSHRTILTFIIARIILQNELTPSIYQSFIDNTWLSNAGITLIETWKGHFQLHVLNDDGHLGNL